MKNNQKRLLIISNETVIKNKTSAVLKQIFQVSSASFNQNITADLEKNPSQLILLIGKSSPVDMHRKLVDLMAIKDIPPIVLLSDLTDAQFVIDSFRLGVVDYIRMPLNMGEVITVLNQQFKRLAARKEVVLDNTNFLTTALGKLKKHTYLSPLDDRMFIVDSSLLNTQIPEDVAFLKVQFFGKFHIHFQNQNITKLFGKRAKSLLAFLLLNHRKPICRDKLIELFWPYSATQSAKNNLNVTIHSIRKIFQDLLPDLSIFNLENDCYTFAPNVIIQTDIEQYEEAYRKGKAIANTVNTAHAIEEYQSVIQCYKGDFLEDMYESWAEKNRDYFREIYLFSLNQLSSIFFEQQQYLEAIRYGQLILEKDGCMEDVHRKLMLCYHQLGMSGKVIRQYQKCEKMLAVELEMTPSCKTVSLLRELKAS